MAIIELSEAYRQNIVKRGHYIDYQPQNAYYILEKSDTGFNEKQTFSTEPLKWRLEIFNGKIILIAEKPTEQRLGLKGEIGYKNGVGTQHKLCRKLYTNSSLASDVISMTVEIQEANPHTLSKDYSYWLAATTICCGRADCVGCVEGYKHAYLNTCYGEKLGVRPVVYLNSGVLIMDLEQEDGGSENSPWKIKICDLFTTELIKEARQLIQKGKALIKEGEEKLKEVEKRMK